MPQQNKKTLQYTLYTCYWFGVDMYFLFYFK